MDHQTYYFYYTDDLILKNIFNEIIADVFNLEKVPLEEKFIKL